MKKLSSFLFIILAFISTNSLAAVKVVECEDNHGNRTFQTACPPGSTQISEKKIITGSAQDETDVATDIEVVLYVIPDCEACDEIREFLGSRNISITEKNVNDNLELQQELTEVAGALKVPTTIIGDEILTGYSRSKFLSVLEAAGYKEVQD